MSKTKTVVRPSSTTDHSPDAVQVGQSGPAPIPTSTIGTDLFPPPSLSDFLSGDPEAIRFAIAKRIAHTLSESSLVPANYRGRAADCFVAIQMGHSVGMDPFQAIQSIAVIDGKPCLYGDGLIGVVKASPLCLYVKEWIDGDVAHCETQRRGDPEVTSRAFSMAEAGMAGLTARDPWKKYPKRMLQMRARAWCLRDAYPDVLKGLRIAEEVIDFNQEPAPIQDFKLPEPAQPVVPSPEPATAAIDPRVTLADVEKAFGAATSMAELIKASALTKKLNSNDDIKKARGMYRNRRSAIAHEQALAASRTTQETQHGT